MIAQSLNLHIRMNAIIICKAFWHAWKNHLISIMAYLREEMFKWSCCHFFILSHIPWMRYTHLSFYSLSRSFHRTIHSSSSMLFRQLSSQLNCMQNFRSNFYVINSFDMQRMRENIVNAFTKHSTVCYSLIESILHEERVERRKLVVL